MQNDPPRTAARRRSAPSPRRVRDPFRPVRDPFRIGVLLAAASLAAPALAQSQESASDEARFRTPLTSELLAEGLDQPTVIAAPPGDPRIFVGERSSGLIRIVEDGQVLPTPFLDLTGFVEASFFEQGLLGMAFHPDYEENGYFFVCFTAPPAPGTTVLVRFRVSESDPNVATVGSGVIFLAVPQPFEGHNGGCVEFGIDGYLYLSTGDGGFDDPFCLARDDSSLLGRILRIDVDTPGPSAAYSIPPDNPFVGDPSMADETWHHGLRNPWRFAIDSATGDLYIGDVGRDEVEEIDFSPFGVGGRDFGWKFMEGSECFDDGKLDNCPPQTPLCLDSSYAMPIHEYGHTADGGGLPNCAIIGGEIYRGDEIPDLDGTYFFGDFCSGRIWSLRYDGTNVLDFAERTEELDPPGDLEIRGVRSFGLDGQGRVCLLDGLGGRLFRITSEAPRTKAASVSRNAGANLETYQCQPPVIGRRIQAVCNPGATGHDMVLIFGFDSPAELVLSGGQVLLCRDGGLDVIVATPWYPGPVAEIPLDVPQILGLTGFRVYTQAISAFGATPFALSNAQDWTFGF